MNKDYRQWLEWSDQLMKPLQALMTPDAAELPIEGPASNHDLAADRLEAFARPLLLAAHWITPPSAPLDPSLSKEKIAAWFRQALLQGTDPQHRNFWGPAANYHQHTVEMGAVVLALEIAPDWFWNPLSTSEKAQVARWIGSVRGTAHHRNNHFFFGVLPLSFLIKHGYGTASDTVAVLDYLNQLERMILGKGWFIDGMNETVDHYNAYAFHYYGLWWSHLYGPMDPTRADRWKNWAQEFIRSYSHFFAASGEPVPFGRSLSYRFAATAPFSVAQFCGVSDLDPGMLRRLCTRCMEFFLSHPIQQSQGVISIGWTNPFVALGEAYSCGASPYWAAKGLAPLLIPENDPFWTASEQPIPAEKSDFSLPLPQTGLAIRSRNGAVELLNAGTSISAGNVGFGTAKWGKLHYRTGIGFEILNQGVVPLDAGLSAESVKTGLFYTRHSTTALEVAADHLACAYSLGDKPSQYCVTVESFLAWKGDWHLHVHQVEAWTPTRLRLGGYSLADKLLTKTVAFPSVEITSSHQRVLLQALHGFQEAGVRQVRPDQDPRTHLYGPSSITPFLQTDSFTGVKLLVAWHWTGLTPAPINQWKISKTTEKNWTLQHPEEGEWQLTSNSLPALTAKVGT